MSLLSFLGSLLSPATGLLLAVAFFVGRGGLVAGSFACGLAFFTAVLSWDKPRAPAVGLCCFLGFLSRGYISRAILGGAMLMALYLATGLLKEQDNFWLQPPSLALALVLLTSPVVAGGWQGGKLLTAGLEGLLVLILTMIFLQGLPLLTRRGSLRGLDNEESICLIVLATMVMLGFSGLRLGGISFQQVLGKYLIMLMALTGGAGMGAALGTSYGITGILAGILPPTAPGAYAFAGLLAGAFRGLGKAGAGLSFLLGDFFLSLYFLHAAQPGLVLVESLLSLAFLFFTPSRYVSQVAQILPGTYENRRLQQEYDRRVRQVASGRLREVAAVFGQLAGTLNDLAITEKSREEERLEQVFRAICRQVCESCNLYPNCWEEEYKQTYRFIFRLMGLAELNKGLEREDIQADMRRRCVRLPELISCINHLYQMHRLNLYWQRRLSEKGSMVSDQLRGVSQIVAGLARQLNLELDYREGLTASLLQQLAAADIHVSQAHILCGPGDMVEVNISKEGCRANAECSRIIRQVAEEVCGRRLRLEQKRCALRRGGGQCLLRLVAARHFRVVTGAACRARGGAPVSGDNYSVYELEDGRVALILSDGMGVGPRAAAESATTISLLERLLNAGFNEELSLRTVNNILLLRSGGENFATVDLVVLDLYLGEAEFVKVGSYLSYLKRGKEVSRIEPRALPIGIVEDIHIQPLIRRLRDGDVIVMVTDGVLGGRAAGEGGPDWLEDFILRARTDEPGLLARQILARGEERPGRKADDMAVLVARIERED